MDTSETYIKMASKAVEIQPAYNPLFKDCEKHQIVDGDWWVQTDVMSTDWKVIWLPRQDQLQDMLDDDAITLQQRMTEFILRYAYVPLGKLQPTYEQLWLKYVMHEKFNKTWDGEDWLKNR